MFENADELKHLETALGGLRPRGQLDRDRLLFLAGQAAAQAVPARRLPSVLRAALLATAAGIAGLAVGLRWQLATTAALAGGEHFAATASPAVVNDEAADTFSPAVMGGDGSGSAAAGSYLSLRQHSLAEDADPWPHPADAGITARQAAKTLYELRTRWLERGELPGPARTQTSPRPLAAEERT